MADELVKEFKDEETDVCDEKNIRRRAYDALNVLTAMDIIAKDKKVTLFFFLFFITLEPRVE